MICRGQTLFGWKISTWKRSFRLVSVISSLSPDWCCCPRTPRWPSVRLCGLWHPLVVIGRYLNALSGKHWIFLEYLFHLQLGYMQIKQFLNLNIRNQSFIPICVYVLYARGNAHVLGTNNCLHSYTARSYLPHVDRKPPRYQSTSHNRLWCRHLNGHVQSV